MPDKARFKGEMNGDELLMEARSKNVELLDTVACFVPETSV